MLKQELNFYRLLMKFLKNGSNYIKKEEFTMVGTIAWIIVAVAIGSGAALINSKIQGLW